MFLFARRQPRRAGGFRPRLEILEDRLAPAVYTVNSPLDLSIAAGVDTTTGAINGTNGLVTLRSAVQASNNNPTTGGNTIDLPSGTYTLGIAPTDSDLNDTGDLNILSGSVTIQGADPANTLIDGGGLDRVLNVGFGLGAPVSLTLKDLTVQNGSAPVNVNATALGGGILVNGGATLALTDVRVTGNQAGSPAAPTPVAIGEGGGIAALFGSTLTLTNVLVDHNTAFGAGGTTSANGGAVFASSAAAVSVTNSTFADNTAGAGGGFFEFNDGLTNAVTFLNSTIADNTGGGILVSSAFSTTPTLLPVLENTLVAGNTSGDDVQGMVQSNGHNLIQDPTGATGLTSRDITGRDPLLGQLTDNGGLLPTLALMTGSPAIDAGDSAVATGAGLTTDQRGLLFDRIAGATVDIGAFEVQGLQTLLPTTITTLAASPSPVEFGAAILCAATVTSAAGTPTGTVSFFLDGSTTPAVTVPLQPNGITDVVPFTLDVGAHTLVATYNGGTAFAASTSNTVNEIVLPNAATQTVLTADLNPAGFGVSVVITATVTSAAPGTPTGTVSFFLDGSPTAAATVPLQSNGTAAFNTSALPSPLAVGNHTVVATYSGDNVFPGSTSATFIESVAIQPTTTRITAFRAFKTKHGKPVGRAIPRYLATVTSALGFPPPDGSSVFYFEERTKKVKGQVIIVRHALAQVPLGPDGTAFLPANVRPGLGYQIVAVYSGDSEFASSQSDPFTPLAF
jgi:hypothetical protein